MDVASWCKSESKGSDSGHFKKVAQFFLVKVPNESAILEHSKNMYINGVYLYITGNITEVTQLYHQILSEKCMQK